MTFAGACSPKPEKSGLPVTEISIVTPTGPHRFRVEIAADDASRAHGLMFRKSLDPDAGMLFDYHHPQLVAFWMKNTPLPLDMLFIRADGTVSTIVSYTTPYSETPIPSMEPVRAVLELNGGRAGQLGIVPGARVSGAGFPASHP